MKFKRRPIPPVEAKQLTDQTMWEIMHWLEGHVEDWNWGPTRDDSKGEYISFFNWEGKFAAMKGDWIIRDSAEQFHVYRSQDFQVLFEPVLDDFNPEDFLQDFEDPNPMPSFPLPKHLSDMEIEYCLDKASSSSRNGGLAPWHLFFAREIEKALMEKNL